MPRRLLILPTLAALLTAAVALAADEPAKTQDKALEGEWNGVSAVRDGTDQGPPPGGKCIMTIKGDSISIQLGDDTHNGTIKIDASKSPKTIDMTHTDGPDKGETNLGIYEIKGDELRLVINDPGKDRPTEITSKPGSGWQLITFKRVKK